MAYPEHYRFTREHMWITLDGVIASIGITDYAQCALLDIIFVEIVPRVGDQVVANYGIGSIESIKALNELYSPVTGTVVAVNEGLAAKPEPINKLPMETWIIKVEVADSSEFDSLLDGVAYDAYLNVMDAK
jgi:glycine cleavage system H protein